MRPVEGIGPVVCGTEAQMRFDLIFRRGVGGVLAVIGTSKLADQVTEGDLM